MDPSAPEVDETSTVFAEVQRRTDAESADERPTSLGLAWHDDLVTLAPENGAKESWLASSAANLQLHFQSLDDDMLDTTSGKPLSISRGRLCFEVASLWFKLFKRHGVGLFVAERWLRRGEHELNTLGEPSEDKQELHDDVRLLREEIQKMVLESKVGKLRELLVSRDVRTIISRVRSLEEGDDWNKKAWIMLVMRAITELLDALSKVSQSTYTNEQISAVFYSQQLAELFGLVQNRALLHWFTSESDRLSQVVGSATGAADVVELVEQVIRVSKSVGEIVSVLRVKCNLVLSTFERSYLGIRLIRHNLEQFGNDVETLVKQSNWNTTKILVENLGKITEMKDIPAPFSGLKSCEVLLANKEDVDRNEEQKCISRFKISCLQHQISLFGPRDVDFMDAVHAVLRTCVDVDAVSHALGLPAFCEERENACGKLVTRILQHSAQARDSDAAMTRLYSVAGDLEDHVDQWLIEDKLKELVLSYISNAQVRKVMLDGRQVIEVKCKKIALSKVLPEVLSMFEHPRVEEVRFVVPNCFLLDVNLEAHVWHGVNVWIQTAVLKVVGHVRLDVSGFKGTPAEYQRKAANGTTYGESGRNGNDGYAGESGGNVAIFAEEIDHQERLTVVTRGGDGGKGQDGGDGVHGSNGFSHTFESLSTFFGQESFINWHHDTLVQTIEHAKKTVIEWSDQMNFYHVKTKDGGEIMYSYNWDTQYAYTAHTPWHNHSFFYHKGGPGMAGGQGGKPGRGGMGGYGGLVEINTKSGLTTQDVDNGTNGENGKPGKGSKSGRSGYDIAFTPNETTAATWYGEDKSMLLEVQFTASKPSGNWTWSPYKNAYALIVESQRAVTYQQSVQEKIKENSKLQTQATANKKKNVSIASMLKKYQAYTTSVEVTSVVRDNFEKMLQRETAELKSLSAVSVKEKVKIRVRRDVLTAEEPDVPSRGATAISVKEIEFVDASTAEAYVEDMVSNPNVTEKWANLKKFVPSTGQFQRLFEAQTADHSSPDIERFLLDKYRLNSLQELIRNGEKYFGMFSKQQPATSIEKYMFEGQGQTLVYDTSTHESVQKHFDELQGIKHDDANETVRQAVKYFADDAKNIVHSEVMNEYIDACTKLETVKERAWQKYMEVLEKNTPAHDLWIRAYNGEQVNDELRAVIAQDMAAQGALVEFCAVPEFDWNPAAKDVKVLKEVSVFLAASGSLRSGCFREILAYATNQHILVYRRDDDNNDGASFTLAAEHGKASFSKLYVYETSRGEFKQLEFNNAFFDLEHKRRFKSDVFAFVLEKIKALQTKEDIDSFIRKLVPTDEGPKTAIQSLTTKIDRYAEPLESSFDIDVASVVDHFPPSTGSFLFSKLQLLQPRYARNGIVSSLARRLAVDQLQVSDEVVHWLVDLAVEAVAKDSAMLVLCQFIVEAYHQEDWAAEMLLIQLEDQFRKEISNKDDLRGSLKNISDQVVLLLANKLKCGTLPGKTQLTAEDAIRELVEKLVKCDDVVIARLRNVGIDEWVYVLEEIAWRKDLEKLAVWKEEQLQECVHFLSTLAWKRGMAVVKLILNKISEKGYSELSATAILELLFYLKSDECHLSNDELPTFVMKLSFEDWNNSGRKKLTLSQGVRSMETLVQIINNNTNTSEMFVKNLEKISAEFKNARPLSTKDPKEIAKELQAGLDRSENASVIDKKSLEMYIDLVNIIDTTIREVFKFNLRATQKLSALLLLTNKNKSLIEVATGEGKTIIVLVVAIIKVLCGQNVHIVTSSSVLAKRDATAEQNVLLCSKYGVKVSHNCSENVEERRSAYSTNQVVYGDLSNFQRDHLLDSFYQKNIMGDHTQKQIMIIDEVDSMLIDKGNNMLYLSHDIGDLDKLDSVFAFIWQWINDPSQDALTRFNVDLIKSQIISDLYSSITREDLQLLDKTLSLVQVEELWNGLQDSNIITRKGILKSDDSWNEEALQKACTLPTNNNRQTERTNRVRFLLQQRRDQKKAIEVPNFLKPFVAHHVDVWIRNAMQTLLMEENQDYVVDVDRGQASADVFQIVTILDKDTGTDQANSQWDGGLHQFLQIKHGCKLSPLSLKAVFISNVTYFKLYDSIYGMTGTLGTTKEKEMLQRVHGVDFVILPTFKAKKFKELPPVVCGSRRDWIACVVEETRAMLDVEGRAMLIICETIEEVLVLAEALREAECANVHVYTRDYETFKLPGGKLKPGHVVVATNLAGRGTDIKPTDSLLAAGGLHVVLSYLPRSGRVEKQAFGRAARKGDPGTGRLVVCVTGEGGTSELRVADMRARRDAKSQNKTEEFYENQILGEEACMTQFTELYKKLEEKLEKGKHPEELKNALLQFYINKWALWLDQNETNLKKMNQRERNKSLGSELSLHTRISESYKPEEVLTLLGVLDQPSTLVKIGKFFLALKPNISIELFDAVVKREPLFSESALYYKCAARVNLMHETDDHNARKKKEDVIREDLRLAAMAIDRRKSSVLQIARSIAGSRQKQVRVSSKDAFQTQTQNLVLVYEALEKSIDEICGASMSGFLLGGGDVELGEKVEKDLQEKKILRGLTVRDQSRIPTKDQEKISSDYCLTYKDLFNLISVHHNRDVRQFEKKIEEKIPLRNRKSFWDILSNNEIIHDESELIAIVKDTGIFESDYPKLEKVAYENDIQSDVYYLYSDQLPATNEEKIFFTKSDLVAAVGVKTFNELIKKGDALELKRAVLRKENLLAKTFLWADYITLHDFEVTRITGEDAILVVRELEEQKILEKRGDSYFLVSHDFRDDLQLSLPLYEETILNFLAVFFAYDLAFARIQRSVSESPAEYCTKAIQIPLMSNPHRGLLMDLFDCGILERDRVDPQCTDIEETVTKMYTNELEVTEIESFLNDNKGTQGISKYDPNELYNLLQDHKWLSGTTIEDIDTRLTLASSECSDLEPALGKLFDERTRLASMVKSLVKNLEHGRGLLSTLSYPTASLTLLSEEAQTQGVNIEELTIFTLNGFDQLIMLGEKKYTIWMILSAAAVIVMGICQIVAGVIIEVCSIGMMTHVGGALIGEGIGDIIYGIGAFSSGEFSWKDYGTQKAISIAVSVATAGVGALLSRGMQASRFGAKLIGVSVGRKIAGKALLKQVGAKVLFLSAAKRVGRKVGEGIAKYVSSIGIDLAVEHSAKLLCIKMAGEIAKNFSVVFEGSNALKDTLANVLGALGHDGAKIMVMEIVHALLASPGVVKEWMKHVNVILQTTLAQFEGSDFVGIAARLGRMAASSVKLLLQANDVLHICQNITIKLQKDLSKKNYLLIEKKNDSELAIFNEDVKKEIEHLVKKKIADMLTDNFARPIVAKSIRLTSKALSKATFLRFSRNRQQKIPGGMALADAQPSRESYKQTIAASMRKLLARRKDPVLVSQCLIAGIPLTTIGIVAVTSAVSAMSKTNITITVHGDNKKSPQRYTAKVDNKGKWPHEDLKVEESLDMDATELPEGGGNSYLFAALALLLPGDMNTSQFQERLAEVMRTDSVVQQAVRRGWHLVETFGHQDLRGRRLAEMIFLSSAQIPRSTSIQEDSKLASFEVGTAKPSV